MPRYQGDDQYLRDVFAPIPAPRSASVKKTRKAAAAAGPSPQQLLAKVHADARTFDMVNRLLPLIVKQLGDVRMLA